MNICSWFDKREHFVSQLSKNIFSSYKNFIFFINNIKKLYCYYILNFVKNFMENVFSHTYIVSSILSLGPQSLKYFLCGPLQKKIWWPLG